MNKFKIGDEVIYINTNYFGRVGKIISFSNEGKHVVLDNMDGIAAKAFGISNLELLEIYNSSLYKALNEKE